MVIKAEVLDSTLYLEEDILSELDELIKAFKASSDPDTLYYHEAMNEPDADKFRKAMVKEVQDHTKQKHWEAIQKDQVPKGEDILPAVWAMKRK